MASSLTPDVIAQLKQEHGELNQYTVADLEFVCKAPNAGTYERFRTQIFDDTKKSQAAKGLFMGCVVWPKGDELKAALDRRPGAVESIASDLSKWAGLVSDVEKKAL